MYKWPGRDDAVYCYTPVSAPRVDWQPSGNNPGLSGCLLPTRSRFRRALNGVSHGMCPPLSSAPLLLPPPPPSLSLSHTHTHTHTHLSPSPVSFIPLSRFDSISSLPPPPPFFYLVGKGGGGGSAMFNRRHTKLCSAYLATLRIFFFFFTWTTVGYCTI